MLDKPMTELSAYCIRIAEEQGLSHQAIADATNTPVSTVDKFLNRRNPPTDMRYSVVQPVVAWLTGFGTDAPPPLPDVDMLNIYRIAIGEKNLEIAYLRSSLTEARGMLGNRGCEAKEDFKRIAYQLALALLVTVSMLAVVVIVDILNRNVGWIR